ncbi:MAG: tetratricopeptide repeat protein [Oceanococcus sp.]
MNCVIGLCVALALYAQPNTASAQTAESDRLPPDISHNQTLRLFERKKYQQAFKAALHRYEWGDNDLHTAIGVMYRNGWGTSRNLQKAREHLQLSAERGSKLGRFQYAEMLRLGEGGSIDRTAACHWYEKSRTLNTTAEFQAALCALRSGNSKDGLNRLHLAALSNHVAATKRLLSHYRQVTPERSITSPHYLRALQQWSKNDLQAALSLAQHAIRAGDYRAYAVLGESQRTQTDAIKELIDDQVEIGQLFGSALPEYATAQRLFSQGYEKAACRFFQLAYQKGLPLSGIEVARCLNSGQLETEAEQEDSCGYISSAFEAGYQQSAKQWMQCQINAKRSPADLALAYVRTIELDASYSDFPFAESVCKGLPTHTLALGADIKLHNTKLQRIDRAAIDVCELQRNGNSILVFQAQNGWLANVSSYEFTLPVVRHKLALQGLTRATVRKQLNRERGALMPLELSLQRDRLRPKSTGSVELLIDYANNGDATRIVESCKSCSEDHYLQRAKKLTEQLGDPLSTIDSENFAQREWKILNWDVQLMLKRGERQLRQVFTQRANRHPN